MWPLSWLISSSLRVNSIKNYYKTKLLSLSNSKTHKTSSKSMTSLIPKLTSSLSLNYAMKTSPSPSKIKKPSHNLKPSPSSDKSSTVIVLFMLMISFIAIWSLPIFLSLPNPSRSLILVLPSKALIWKKKKTIMLGHLFTCHMKPSTTIFTATRAIFGLLESFSMKCSPGGLHGEPKLSLIWKKCLNLTTFALFCLRKLASSQKIFSLKPWLSILKVECRLNKFADFSIDNVVNFKCVWNQRKCFLLSMHLLSEQEPFLRTIHHETPTQTDNFC